jgi:uncharacterized membrane protein YgcG
MRKTASACFLVAFALFGMTAFEEAATPAYAQMVNSCPGGSTLLCGTSTRRVCTAVDQRTAQCSAWTEETLYYYYAATSGGDGGGGGGGSGSGGGGDGSIWCSDPERAAFTPEQCGGSSMH